MGFSAQTGFSETIPVRLAAPEQHNLPATRPVVDIKTLSAKAGNEIIDVLAKYQEEQKKAGRKFLRQRPAKPEIDLTTVTESIREAVETAYRVSAAACQSPILDLTPEHMSEVEKLQDQAVEMFCKDMLRVTGDDQELLEQIYQICPSLRPAPDPDLKALADLQRKVDGVIAEATQVHQKLIAVLEELDELVKYEAQALAGTNMAGSGRLRRQREYLRYELVRALETGRQLDLKIPVARWE